MQLLSDSKPVDSPAQNTSEDSFVTIEKSDDKKKHVTLLEAALPSEVSSSVESSKFKPSSLLIFTIINYNN